MLFQMFMNKVKNKKKKKKTYQNKKKKKVNLKTYSI